MRRLLPARLLEALRPDAPATPYELPGDQVRESRRRVLVAAAIGTAVYAVFLAFELGPLRSATGLERAIDRTHDLVAIGLGGLLLLVASWRAIPDRAVLRFALGLEVLLCALISIAGPWAGWVRTAHVSTLTWVVPIVILFPLLVPAPPRTALLVSTLGALTMPAGLWALAASGRVRADALEIAAAALNGAVAVGIATIASRTVYGAGRQVAAARRLGSYELLEPLGQGGMGEVWKARHAFLARPAAVKLIHPDQLRGPLEERDEVVRRFTREAQATASLRSPHTVVLFDFGVSADGTFFYAMELLDGMNIEHFVYRYGPVEPRRVVSWLAQACHSLGEAHALNLVHRDVKPGNLLVCRYGREVDFLKVLDFGLTRAVTPREDDGLTVPGTILGTPGYMAPEQVFGLPAGPGADLYALGCVGYWLLTGRKPFEADSGAELMRRHAQEPPPPLPRREGHPVPERLERLILSCLAKDPKDRPRDADAMRSELARCVDGRSWTEADARAWWDRHPVGA